MISNAKRDLLNILRNFHDIKVHIETDSLFLSATISLSNNILISLVFQVKQRLDYQLELSNVMRRVEQKHMVDWIISNVKKNITAKQEDDALKKCVADLKSLSTA